MADDPAPPSVPRSTERAVLLLSAVIEHGQLPLGRAASDVGLSPSTALRHLRALERHGFVARDDNGLFSAGPTFLRLALNALSEGPTAQLIAAAQPHLDALAATTGESSYLALRDGSAALYVSMAEGTQAVRHVGWTGRSVPIDGTAVGAALCAEVAPHTPGPAFHNTGGVEPDVTAVAVPVIVGGDRVVAALSVLGPSFRFTGQVLAAATDAVVTAATAFGNTLGSRFHA